METPFAELPAFAMNDRGLLGVTLDPDFSTNHFIYFYYIDKNDSFHKIVRYTAINDVGENKTLIYSTNKIAAELHAGGGLDFGTDGKLYVAIGDSGPSTNAQNLSIPMGKVLRMNKDGTAPQDNPFVNLDNNNPYIWAYGFRNPFRMQFDSQTGNLYLGDVGYQAWEEVNKIVKGGNYGWPLAEGSCTSCPYINPIHTYTISGGASIIIGPTYHGSNFPDFYQNRLFIGDYVKHFIKTIALNSDGSFASIANFDTNVGSIVDLKMAPDGTLYYVTIFPGKLFQIKYTQGNKSPIVKTTASPAQGAVPLTVNFSSSGTSDPEGAILSYSWDFGDRTSSSEPNPTKIYTNAGKFLATLTVSDGSASTSSTPLDIQVGEPPTVAFVFPTDGHVYKAGDNITYKIESNSEVSFEVIFHHDTHIHPFLNATVSTEGTFTIPNTGETSANTWYELIATAQDSNNLTATKSIKIVPQKTKFTLNTDPPEYKIALDGTPIYTPITIEGVVGFKREIDAITQNVGSVYYEFDKWSDNGAKNHVITLQPDETTYTADFKVQSPTPTISPTPTTQDPVYKGEYFSNQNLSGIPTVVKNDDKINFIWNRNKPDNSLPSDQFSVRWTKVDTFETGIYRFVVASDDGVRLYIDGKKVLDKWNDQPMTFYSIEEYLPSGKHTIIMEYYEAFGGAIAILDYKKLPDTFKGEYYDNINLLEAPKVIRQDSKINFVWNGESTPDPQIPKDKFSIRWTKKQYFKTKNYSFTLKSDDGIRFWIDDQLIIDDWRNHGMITYTPTVDITEGIHNIKIEYFENTGGAVAIFNQNN